MKTTIKTYKDLPLEEGKTYITKFATGEKFTITKIVKIMSKGVQVGISDTVYGIYERAPSIGECPLSSTRIIHDKEFIKTIDVCHKCKLPLNKEDEFLITE